MAEPHRQKTPVATEEERARVRQARLSALLRLKENPDFHVLLAFMQEQYAARWRMLPRTIADPQEQARYNFLMGEMSGIQLAMAAADTLVKADTQKSDSPLA